MTGPGPADQKPTRAGRGSASDAAAAADQEVVPTAPATIEGVAPAAPAPVGAAPKPKTARPSAKAAPPEPGTVAEPAAVAAVAAPAVVPAAAVVPGPAVVPAAAVAAAAPMPAPAPVQAAPDIERPADAGPGAPGAPPAAPTARSTPDVAAAVDKAFGRLREHLTVGEIVAGLGAGIILGVAWAVFGFLFGHEGTLPSQLVLLLSVGLLAILVVQNGRVHDFGSNDRVLVTGLCLALGFLAAVDILGMIRGLVDGMALNIGGLTWWAGAIVAVFGGWMVWREPR